MMEIYQEDDFLKPFRSESGLWCFRYEGMLVNAVSSKIEIGLCSNSIPAYCRYGKVGNTGHSLLSEQSWQHDNVTLYDEQCPKCGWGIYAFLAAHGKLHHGSIRFYDGDRGVIVGNLYRAYFNLCKSVYECQHESDYQYYRGIQDNVSLSNLDEAFVSEHLAFENANIIRTEELGAGSVDSLFFGGGLKPFADGYADWVADTANVLRTKVVVAGCFDEDANKQDVKQHKKREIVDFRQLLQGNVDKDMLMNKLHSILDGKGGKDVALCLIRAKHGDNIIFRFPTEAEYKKEFVYKGKGFWATQKYWSPEIEEEVYMEAMQVRIID